MPGRAYHGSLNHRLNVNSTRHDDSFGVENVDVHWETHLPYTLYDALPFCPSKQKDRLPVQSPSSWLTVKKEQQTKLPSSKLLRSEKSSMKFNSSNESEHDLQAMVFDFMENDSCEWDNSDSDNNLSPISKRCDSLQVLTSSSDSVDRELLANVTIFVIATNDDTALIQSSEAPDCKGNCTRRFVVTHLRSSGYDAALCQSRWPNSGRVPGGEYEYIDVKFEGDQVAKERLIVDIDFRSQFEIARPTQHYQAALKYLPAIFVGTSAKLEQVLEIMSEAAKGCWRQNCLHLPPWRTLEYISAKWLSSPERTSELSLSVQTLPCSSHRRSGILVPTSLQIKRCGYQRRLTQVSVVAEGKVSTLPAVAHGNARADSRNKVSYW